MSVTRIKASEWLAPPGPTFRDLATDREHVFVVGQKEAALVHLGAGWFLPGSPLPVPPPPGATTAAAGPIPMPPLSAALALARRSPGARALVSGHSQGQADAALDAQVSHGRAAAVLTLLRGERAAFIQIVTTGRGVAETLAPDQRRALDWISAYMGWPCGLEEHDGDLFLATAALQRAYNRHHHAGSPAGADLEISGIFDDGEWGALYDCLSYCMAEELDADLGELARARGALRFAAPPGPAVACGRASVTSRAGSFAFPFAAQDRVDILFFDGAAQQPEVPCGRGRCRPDACELMGAEYYKLRPQEIPSPLEQLTFALVDELGDPLTPLPREDSTPIYLTPDGIRRQRLALDHGGEVHPRLRPSASALELIVDQAHELLAPPGGTTRSGTHLPRGSTAPP